MDQSDELENDNQEKEIEDKLTAKFDSTSPTRIVSIFKILDIALYIGYSLELHRAFFQSLGSKFRIFDDSQHRRTVRIPITNDSMKDSSFQTPPKSCDIKEEKPWQIKRVRWRVEYFIKHIIKNYEF